MALRVWLPLNGNLENKGISNITITNNGVTVDNNGKIGKCYNFDGSDDFIQLEGLNFMPSILSKEWSCSFWIYNADSGSRSIIFSNYGLGGVGGASFGFEKYANDNLRIVYNNGNFDINVSQCVLTPNDWTHVVVTKTINHLVSVYKNGSFVYSTTNSNCASNGTLYYLGRDSRTGDTAFKGKLNDFRFYDHCLSAKEVKEISQGLVLHYKLDGFSGGAGENLISNSAPKDLSGWSSAGSGWSNSLVDCAISPTGKAVRNTYTGTTATSGGIHKPPINYSELDNGEIYTFSAYLRASKSCQITLKNEMMTSITSGTVNPTLTTQWQRYEVSGPINTSATYHSDVMYVVAAAAEQNMWIEACMIKLEKGTGASAWSLTPTEMNIDTTKIKDSSGYENDGIIINTISAEQNSPRYQIATHISSTSSKIKIDNLQTSGFGNSYTFAWWAKISSVTPMHWGFANGIRLNGMYTGRLWNTGDGSNNPLYNPGTTTQVTAPTVNTWHHWAMVGNGSKCLVYQDGQLWAEAKTYKAISGTTIYINGWDSGTSYCSDNLSISDFRIYATALSAEDILDLYHTPANIDNLGGIHGFEMAEKQGNIFSNVNIAITGALDKNANGVGTYTQANCTVTYENNAIRIYRPPNITHNSSSMHNMWGGMRLRNSSVNSCHEYNENTDNIFGLQKNHTYVIYFTVKGQSSNAATSVGWTNQMGWGGGGLTPNPTNIEYFYTPVNFNGEIQCFYKFTISDDVVKTCTTAYSYATVGKQYLSYNDFMYGFGYESTGSLGTDVYVNNFRMFDITSLDNKNISLNGIINFLSFNEENDDIAHIHKFGEMQVMNIIEK